MSDATNVINEPVPHTGKTKELLDQLIAHAREDMGKVTDPKAQALFEVTAEVLGGLRLAFEHYETGAGAAMQRPASAVDMTSTPLE